MWWHQHRILPPSKSTGVRGSASKWPACLAFLRHLLSVRLEWPANIPRHWWLSSKPAPPPPPKGHARRAAAAALGPGEALPKASPAPGFGGAVLKHQEVVTVPLARTWAAASPLPVLAKRERTQPLASPCGYEERCRAWRLLTKFSLIKRALSSAPNPLPHCQSPSCLSFPTQTQPHSRDSHSATLNQLSSRWCRRHRRPWPAQCEVVLGGQQKLA